MTKIQAILTGGLIAVLAYALGPESEAYCKSIVPLTLNTASHISRMVLMIIVAESSSRLPLSVIKDRIPFLK